MIAGRPFYFMIRAQRLDTAAKRPYRTNVLLCRLQFRIVESYVRRLPVAASAMKPHAGLDLQACQSGAGRRNAASVIADKLNGGTTARHGPHVDEPSSKE
jgi:hypothetical protein